MSQNGAAARTPDVAILLTTFNGQLFLRDQLDSLVTQVGVSIHIYVFDDGSTDDTIHILQAYSENFPGIFTIYRNGVNSGGTGLNLFRGITSVSINHDYVALADQDDVWLPQKLLRAIEALSCSVADLYFSNLLAWDGDIEPTQVVRRAFALRKYDHLFGGGSAGCTYVMSGVFFATLQNLVARTDLRGVDRISHDWIIYFVARHYGYGVVASDQAFIKYRIHSNSQYGGMARGGLSAACRRLRMLRAGFLAEQVSNALRFAKDGTKDWEILRACARGRLNCLAVFLKYRLSLARSKQRFFLLLIAVLVSRWKSQSYQRNGNR